MILADYTEIELFTNHESRDIIAQLILGSMVVIFTCSVLYGLFNVNVEPISFNDKFQIGYIDDNVPQNIQQEVILEAELVEEDELKKLKKQLEIAKLKKQLRELSEPKPVKQQVKQPPVKKVQKKDNPLLADCVSALVGLGTPVRKAKAEVQIIFERNPNIKTVQEFITEYGKR